MPRPGSGWQLGENDKPWTKKPGSEPNLAQKTGGGGRDFDLRYRIVESRVVPDDESFHTQQPPPQQPAPAATGGYRTGGALVRGSRFGSAFDIDVERGPGTPMPEEGGAGDKSRKGSWVDTVTGMMDGLYLAAESVVKDTVRDWEAPPPPPPLSKMTDRTHFGSHGNMTDYGVTAPGTDYGDAGIGHRPTTAAAAYARARKSLGMRPSLGSVETDLESRAPPSGLDSPADFGPVHHVETLPIDRPRHISHPLDGRGASQPPRVVLPPLALQQRPLGRYQLPHISTQPPLSMPNPHSVGGSAGASATPRTAAPPSAIPSSPPKDIGDGILARRAYNTVTTAQAPTTATPPLPPPSQLPIGELKKVATASAPPPTRLEEHITHSTTSLDDGDEARAPKLSRITKYNSCSTLFVEATISSSDLTDTLYCVSRALVRHLNTAPLPTPSPDILSEEKHPLSNHIRFYRRKPREEDVYRFLECLFNAAELTAECGIITLIYVERLLKNTRLSLLPGNWIRIVLGALLLAAKVWDDHAVWNVDFVQIFPDVHVKDMNDLERFYIANLHFNVNIRASEYARYYFALRELSPRLDITPQTRKPLAVRDAGLLSARQPRTLHPIELEPMSSSLRIPPHKSQREQKDGTTTPKSYVTTPTGSTPGRSPYGFAAGIEDDSGTSPRSTTVAESVAPGMQARLKASADGGLRRSASDFVFVPGRTFAAAM
ncbi:Cyclin Y [Geranomyces variabilis]|uniref:Cyclin Y n=1 Tax=Geranomyces variabilis TaxID=109894 RepID=A0AAD5XTN3_9FUNG|nr:Cyclin Y [Geranomyces variabilis]